MQMKPTDWKLLCVRQNDPSFPCGLFFFLEMGGSALQIIPVIISAKDDCVRTITVRTLGQSWTRKSLCKPCRTLIWQFCFLVHVKLASLGFCFKSVWQSDFMISTRSPAINWVQTTKNNHFLNIRLISKGHHEMPKQSKAQWSSLGDDNEQLDHSELFCFYLFSPQISSQTQSRQSSLFRRGRQHQVQRPDPCREQQPDGETLRDLRLAGAVAALVSCLVSVRELWSVCMMVSLLCVCIRLRVRTFTSLNSSGIQLSLCRLCGVLCRFMPSTRCPFPLSFTWVHSACGGSYDTAIMHKERWEINDSARWRQSSFFSLDRAVTCGECHSANIHLRSTPLHSAAAPLCNTARTDALCEIVF